MGQIMANILVVDDEEDIVQLMSETLRLWGHQAVTALDGEEAMTKFQETPVDLVISDIRLPKMNGVRLLEQLRKLDNTIEVILVTGFPEVSTAIDAMKNGAYDYLIKPVDLNELRLKIDRALAKKEIGKSITALRGVNWAMIISIPIWLALGIWISYLIN
jgi:DNA-binding NtrC family response regulator